MATKTKIEEISEIIDKYTENHLDSYVRQTAAQKAEEALKASGHTPESVADAVFDYLYKNHSDNDVMAALSHQVCPKTVLYFMRNDIITALKK